MSVNYTNGEIVVSAPFFERTCYDVSNNKITAQFDGRGCISKYAVMNKFNVFRAFNSVFSINGKTFFWNTEKTVTMSGRKQVTSFSDENADYTFIQFVDSGSNAVYTRITIKAKKDLIFKNAVCFDTDFEGYVEQLFMNRRSSILKAAVGALIAKQPRITERGMCCDITGDYYFDVAVSEGFKPLEKSWKYHNQFCFGGEVKKDESKNFDYVLSAGTRSDDTFSDVYSLLNNFDYALKETENYFDKLPCPCGLDDSKKAYYKSLINCSISNYKELGDWKGFLAGIVYQFPARTYFRDGYWTVLSVLPVRPDLVKNEIITLAKGIDGKTGKCPSAVKFNYKNYWGDHYDSPSFFVMMLYDYVAHTGDKSILSYNCRGQSILDLAVKVLRRLENECDETGLLVKTGEFNRRDWCDNVFREGYCTYDEALYARALYCMSGLLKTQGKDGSEYAKKFEKVKNAINNLLWSDEKGYFVNYTHDDFIEDNLSIDTVLVPLFGLTDDSRAHSVLKAMEKILESKNNSEQCAGDFGVLAVWPPYKDVTDAVQKSALPYNYHNGGDWPYLSAIYSYAKLAYGLDYEYPLYRWFEFNIEKGNYSPVEYFNPIHKDGSLLQAWSSMGAFVLSYLDGKFFTKTID